ncbi:MAG: phosphate signaling complex protein PhoU [bacterium]|jgi:phosphate transport system protein
MLDDRMTNLKRELVEYAGLAESMIEKAVNGLMRKDHDLLIEVIEKDEHRANQIEIEIDELCTEVIAQFQPRAKALRTILMMMKMNNDLERMGDHAVNIAQSATYLIERPLVKPYIDIPRMAKVTIGMLKDSIVAFVEEDVRLARSVCERDNEVDALAMQVMRELVTFMAADPKTIERSLHLIRISGNLERIADLSTNICEDTIFMVEGTVIKHHFDQEQNPAEG